MASETASDEEHPASGDKSLVSLLLRLAHDAETLVLQELMLARAEFLATLAGLRDSSLLMAIGLLVAFVGLMALVASGILALSERMAPWLACLIVGGAVSVVGLGLTLYGKHRASKLDIVPRRTVRSLRDTEEWLKDELK